jgi:hypothetical protein
MKCQCSEVQWGCHNDAVPGSGGYCSDCALVMEDNCWQESCNCECSLCNAGLSFVPRRQKWRCKCTNHDGEFRCVMPVDDQSEYCPNCDPFTHGGCICDCCQCNDAKANEARGSTGEVNDIIDPTRCPCITHDGRQCADKPLEGYEYCEDCSTGYCDCECTGCNNQSAPEPEPKIICIDTVQAEAPTLRARSPVPILIHQHAKPMQKTVLPKPRAKSTEPKYVHAGGAAAEMQKVSIVESPPIASVTSNHQSVDKRI